MQLETIIGLEIHVQLKTKSKMFCACANEFDKTSPNKNICAICTGQPGVLPVVNKQALQYGVMTALALGLKVNEWSKFDRKSYFYPDLPKGYQISQYDEPLASAGELKILLADGEKGFAIERLHLEEDAAKNMHTQDHALIDFNRAGMPLAEIVTRPSFRSPAEARVFLQELKLILKKLKVSDADMEKGQLRCDANISMRPIGDTNLYPKTEIKNLNSFRAIEKALTYEIKRQTELWDKDEKPDTESTRGWDEKKQITVLQRTKEGASDYRYFPEPDLPPIVFSKKEIAQIKSELPELPNDTRKRLVSQYGFKLSDVNIIIAISGLAEYTEKVISEFVAWLEASDGVEGSSMEIWEQYGNKVIKTVVNWLLNNFIQLVNSSRQKIQDVKITPENMAEFLTLIFERKVNSSAAQIILEKMFETGKDPSVILEEEDLSQEGSEEKLEQWIDEVILDNPEQVAEFKAGKEPILKYLIGMTMKKSQGKANPGEVDKILRTKLK